MEKAITNLSDAGEGARKGTMGRRNVEGLGIGTIYNIAARRAASRSPGNGFNTETQCHGEIRRLLGCLL